MTELFLEYKDDAGDIRRVSVSGERCFVGRHSEADVYIPDGRLSRRHLQIERVDDSFIASDAGSSNGSKLNGTPLTSALPLKDGDVLDLGGLTVKAVFKTARPLPEPVNVETFDEPVSSESPEVPVVTDATEPVAPQESDPHSAPPPAPVAASSGSGSMLLWVVIPVFGIIFILFAGAIVFLVLSGPTTTVAKKQTDNPYNDDDDYPDNDNKTDSNKKENSSNSNTKASPSNSNSDIPSTNSNTAKLSETAKIEQNGAAFLRKIAHNDPRAFLTTEQAGKLNTKIKQFSGSSAVAENLKSAARNASQIKSLADSKNLKPQFVAIAAVAKLGTSRGDVLQTAQSMIDVLGKLTVHLGNELADDSLLVIAAYNQGAAGETMKMRNMLQQLANQSPESSRVIRTIWFLQKNGKISNTEFENALNFLAIGTISQNPKDFGVSAEPLTL